MKAALYARVSTTDKDQNPEMQLAKLREYCKDQGWELYQEYVDRAPAGDLAGRKSWTRMMKAAAARRFDVVLVWKIDRAFRSVFHAANNMKMLQGYRVGFRSFMEPSLDTTGPMGEFVFNILVAAAELERATIQQRIQAGVDHARAHGTKSGNPIGRPQRDLPCIKVYAAWQLGDYSYSEAARILSKDFGQKIGHGIVRKRIMEYAGSKGVNVEDLKNQEVAA